MSQQLVEVKAGPGLASGIFPGLPGEAPVLWADGENVLFESGQVKKNPGYTRLDNDTVFATQPSDLIVAFAGTERRAFIGAGAKVLAYRTLDEITEIGSGYAAGGKWQFLTWGNWLIGNNQVVAPQIWKHTTSVLDTSGSAVTAVFSSAMCIAKFRNYLLAGGTSNGNSLIEYSTFGNPEDFVITLTGSAGQLELRDLNAPIVAMVPLGEAIGVYTNENLTWFRYIGGTLRFGYKTALEGIGAITPRSVVSTGVLNYGITPDFIFVTDGNSAEYIHEPAVKKWLEDYVDWTRYDEVHGYFDKLNLRVVWHLPMLAGGTKAIAYRIKDKTWTRLANSMVVGAPQGVWPSDIVADTTKLYAQSKTVYNKDGAAISSFIQSKPLDLGERRRGKRIDNFNFDITKTGTVQVAFAYYGDDDDPNDAPVFETPVTLDPITWVNREARFIAFKITASAVGSNFALNGFNVYGSYTNWIN